MEFECLHGPIANRLVVLAMEPGGISVSAAPQLHHNNGGGLLLLLPISPPQGYGVCAK